MDIENMIFLNTKFQTYQSWISKICIIETFRKKLRIKLNKKTYLMDQKKIHG
jgi:hypothetical protein